MGPQDHLRAFLDGFGCTVCEERVPAGRIRLLAWRDDLCYLQVDCAACGSTSFGFVTDEPIPSEADRLAGASISPDDVLDMNAFLESWTGDLASLVRDSGGRRSRRVGPGDRQAGWTA
ncbi:MAG: hypothetical protein C0498_07705 [Anaerolinea sp.]|nr:hypothetical protein [Anaerolinea sp.]